MTANTKPASSYTPDGISHDLLAFLRRVGTEALAKSKLLEFKGWSLTLPDGAVAMISHDEGWALLRFQSLCGDAPDLAAGVLGGFLTIDEAAEKLDLRERKPPWPKREDEERPITAGPI
jgi:hypothetical protein